jgi:predicted transcriptional regulator of viral defense system
MLEERIAELACRQHGVVTRTQLLELGILSGAVRRRAMSGRLRQLHRGVYLVGPILPPHAGKMAAVLACGPQALLSHRCAACLRGWVQAESGTAPVDVTVAGSHHYNRPGIRVRRVARLERDERDEIDGIPVTAPLRTLIDLASVASARELENAVAAAERQKLLTRTELVSALARYQGRPGLRTLRAVFMQDGGPALTRSEAEARFLKLIRKARLAAPETNVMVAGYEIDFFWRQQCMAVEGRRFPLPRLTAPIRERPPARRGACGSRNPCHLALMASDRRR